MAQANDRLDLLSIFRKDDRARCGSKMNERVGLVGQQIGRIGEKRAAADRGTKIREKRWVHDARVYCSRKSQVASHKRVASP